MDLTFSACVVVLFLRKVSPTAVIRVVSVVDIDQVTVLCSQEGCFYQFFGNGSEHLFHLWMFDWSGTADAPEDRTGDPSSSSVGCSVW